MPVRNDLFSVTIGGGLKRISMKYNYQKIITAACSILMVFYSCKSEKQELVDNIKAGEEKLFSDSTLQLNDSVAIDVLHNYLSYTDKFKEDTLAGDMLFKAADLSNGLQNPKQAIELYSTFIQRYPKHQKVAAALFMQAFLYETALDEKEKAKSKYKEFIQNYPEHPLTPSAQSSYDQLEAGLTDEELIRSFEQKQQSQK